MIRAARKLADCWCDHIGPAPKKTWYDGHEELEQALVRLANFVDAEDGPGKGDKYLRSGQVPPSSAAATASGTTRATCPSCISMKRPGTPCGPRISIRAWPAWRCGRATSIIKAPCSRIWQNIVNKRYYVTGGIGSGETSEGFGANYSLPNNAYCESCANCGLLFFENKMNAIWHDARYADLYEDTYYNAILGDVDLDGEELHVYQRAGFQREALSVARLPLLRRQHPADAAAIADLDVFHRQGFALRQYVCRQQGHGGRSGRHEGRDRAKDRLSVEGTRGDHRPPGEGEAVHDSSCDPRARREPALHECPTPHVLHFASWQLHQRRRRYADRREVGGHDRPRRIHGHLAEVEGRRSDRVRIAACARNASKPTSASAPIAGGWRSATGR